MIKPKRLYKVFTETYKKIHYQKYLRQGKVEEYFIPQLYVPNEDKNIGMMNQNYFNNIKNNILSKIVGNTKENNNNNHDNENNNSISDIKNEKEEEMNGLIEKESSQKLIKDFFLKEGQIYFHSNIKMNLK